jgi:hypothetical protein
VTAARNIIASIAIFTSGMSVAGASAVDLARDAERADPISGLHWQRMMDPERPAAPPRLTLVRGSDSVLSAHRELLRRPAACVRAGDHVSLRGANAGSSKVSLEATALESGVCGDRVRVRIAVTGALGEMTVLGPGAGVLCRKGNAWR